MVYAPVPDDPSLPPIRINLLSDTQTRPSAGMRAAMAAADVGDEQIGADPTVNSLCERVAALLGKQAAVFMPSGTICNIAATLAHCRPGDEILAHEVAHIVSLEGCTHAALGGVQIKALRGANGQFSPDTLRAALRPPDRHQAKQTLVSVEQTTNLGGGTVWDISTLASVAALAKAAGLATHMDGARLLNASVAAGVAPLEMVAGWDSVWIDFSKGLGAPLGAVLAGSRDFIDEVWRWKQRLGGSLRQAGICAAACHYALDHNIDRLADDHANARLLADGLSQFDGVDVQSPETNLVFFDVGNAGISNEDLTAALRQNGVLVSIMGGRMRACTHLDVGTDLIEATLDITRDILQRSASEINKPRQLSIVR
ncbi:threonine aldolase family protein [Rhodopseudomonas sp. HC1]|uniref:threonine aldolase family protein n=1 Tax=Rhodopseudomonas infernalis TaxID=2897386 RepID=UPI001EE7879C|nr:threonine aldolase family protein [Rhodopseudomonas infernalis]MCG6203448.1 threonine aldolase family protein [Rhodopseudomonas infernalis]